MKKMMPLLLVVAVVFLGYWMFTDPARFADVSKDAAAQVWDLATLLFDGLIDFLDEL